MVTLKQQLPSENIQPMWPNFKLYTWALWKDLLSVVDQKGLWETVIPQITNFIEPKQQIVLVRHLESNYNAYKRDVVNTELYKIFDAELDPVKKKAFALALLDDFRKHVGVDYTTGVSPEWHIQWKMLGNHYASLIQQFPDIFPTRIVVSPYLRTRITAHFFLKSIVWLDMNVGMLIDPKNVHDMIVGSFAGKDIVLQLSDDVRERDHGSGIAPLYLKKYMNNSSVFSVEWLPDEDSDQLYYYTSDGGGESQTQVNMRAANHFDSLTNDVHHKQNLVFTHHLFVLWGINTIVKGTHRTFFNVNNHRRPQNGSMTVFSKLAKTDMGQTDKLRIAWYNLMLDD